MILVFETTITIVLIDPFFLDIIVIEETITEVIVCL